MPYITQTDLLKEMSSSDLAKLTGDPDGLVIDDDKVAAAIANADSLINAFLYGQYELPVETIDEIIKQIAVALAFFNLYSYKFRSSFVPNEVLARKIWAMELLDDIYRGKIRLRSPVKSVGILSNTTFRKRYFTDEHLEEFRNFRE